MTKLRKCGNSFAEHTPLHTCTLVRSPTTCPSPSHLPRRNLLIAPFLLQEVTKAKVRRKVAIGRYAHLPPAALSFFSPPLADGSRAKAVDSPPRAAKASAKGRGNPSKSTDKHDASSGKHASKGASKTGKGGSASPSAKTASKSRLPKKGSDDLSNEKSASAAQMTLDDIVEKRVVITAADKAASLFGIFFCAYLSIYLFVYLSICLCTCICVCMYACVL